MSWSNHRASRRVGCVLLATLAACQRPAEQAKAPPPIDIGIDNIYVVDSGLVESGPALSGTLMPVHAAQLRAQVAGAVLALPVKEGGAVRRGEVVAILDTTALAEAVRSAQSQVTSATLAAKVAQRNDERAKTLHAAGAIADRDLELAHSQAVAAEAAAADAQSRLADARSRLDDAMVRAPFAGVVSSRSASVGDVLQSGSPILGIVDPASLELDAKVAAIDVGTLKPGVKVEFSVNGNPDAVFTGQVARVNPTVDSLTRQIELYVTVPNDERTLAAGLFAQGRVALQSEHSLVIPIGAIDRRSTSPMVRRVRGGTVETVSVTLGVRDELTGRVGVISGLALGDTVLTGAATTTPNGVAVHITPSDR